MSLQKLYHEKDFKKYFKLISCLLVAKQKNELSMKNHEIHLIRFAPFLEVNVAIHNNYHSYDWGRGRNNYHYHGGGYNNLDH